MRRGFRGLIAAAGVLAGRRCRDLKVVDGTGRPEASGAYATCRGRGQRKPTQ